MSISDRWMLMIMTRVFEVFKAFKKDMGTIDRVIVNAGMGKGASIGTGYFKANKQTAITNFVSALAQCEAAMEIFREQKRRTSGDNLIHQCGSRVPPCNDGVCRNQSSNNVTQ